MPIIAAKQLWQILIKLFLVFLISLAIFLFFPRVVFGATFSFSSVPITIIEEASFIVDVVIEGLTAGNKYYLRAAFSHPDTPTFYFGYTRNNSGEWYNGKPSPIDHTKFFQIIMNHDRIWSGSFEVKLGVNTSAYKGTGTYNFKIGRYTEAGGGPTWTDNTSQITIITTGTTLSPTPVPISILTPKSPTPTPKQIATYKINEVRDEDGEVLSSVKVYVNEIYLHHYTPEVLTFCDGCQCDAYVSCGFGQHTIRLEKTGYENWSKEITVNPDTFDEVNPVMVFLESNSNPTSVPTLTPTPTLVPTPTLKAVAVSATLSGEILGNQSSESAGFFPLETTQSADLEEELEDSSLDFLPKIFLVVGLVLLLMAGFWVWYNLKYYQED